MVANSLDYSWKDVSFRVTIGLEISKPSDCRRHSLINPMPMFVCDGWPSIRDKIVDFVICVTIWQLRRPIIVGEKAYQTDVSGVSSALDERDSKQSEEIR